MRKLLSLLIPPIVFIVYRKIFKSKNVQLPVSVTPKLIGSYSQHGEDLILDSLFKNKETGFYIDVGAFHPEFQSNTNRFYLRGWSGINIEPALNNYRRFVEQRPRDINVNCGVDKDNSELTFYELEWGNLSSFNRERAVTNAKYFKVKIVDECKIPVKSLKDILSVYIGERQPIDFISIDTEGFEMNVLNGNDWDLFRPYVVVIEPAGHDREIFDFFKNKGYTLVFKNLYNSFYIDTRNGLSSNGKLLAKP